MAHPKGQPRHPSSGRKKGTPNKQTQLLKDAILNAARLAGEAIGKPKDSTGLEKYLFHLAMTEPAAFCSMLSKVMPLQIGGNTDEGDGINITVSFTPTREEMQRWAHRQSA